MVIKTINILLSEDNPSDARLVHESLRETGLEFQLTVLEDGEQTLNYLLRSGEYKTAEIPDLLLLDLNMPKVSGLEVLEKIKDNKTVSALPIVLLTVSDSQEEILKALSLRMHYYIRKPIDPLRLYKLLAVINQSWCQGEEAVESNEISYVMAGNPHTPQTVLQRLASCQNDRVRMHLAENPSAGRELQQILAEDPCPEVRQSLACQANLPEEILARLAHDECADVRMEIAQNPKTPKEIKNALRSDENPYVAESARRNEAN